MITSVLLTILSSFFQFVAGLLPASTGLPTQITAAFSFVTYQISTWSFIFPLATVFTILSLVLVIEFTLWSFHGVVWIYHKVRGI